MKAVLERAALLKAIGRVNGVVDRRNTIPILSNLLISADGDGAMRFTGTDLDIEVIETVDARVAEPGAVTAPAQLLHEIVRKLPDGAEVSLEADAEAQRLNVRAGRSRFALATLPREDYPALASDEFSHEFEVRAGDFARLFEKTRFAISTEETRYYLGGVYLHLAEEEGAKKLRGVATDGHRLARIDMAPPAGGEGMPGVIVPRKTVGELLKLLDDEDEIAQVWVSESKVRFRCGEAVLTSKVIDGAFPDYSRVIPRGADQRMEADAEAFAKAVDRVSTVSAEKTRAVRLALEEDRLTLSVNSPDAGDANEELTVLYSGAPIVMGFNAKYLMEIASQIDRENAVFLFSDSTAPAILREGDDESAVYVVMPMRV